MGRNRSRQIYDDDDSPDEVPEAKPLGGSPDEVPEAKPLGGSPSGEFLRKNQEERAIVSGVGKEGRREEMPQTRSHGGGRPSKHHAPESNKEVAINHVEQQRREEDLVAEPMEQRRRHREVPTLAEPMDQQQDVVDLTAAVPIGDPVMVSGRRGKKQKKHYASFEYNGLIFEMEDFVLVEPELANQKPYAAIIKDITKTEGSVRVTCQWFYRPEEAEVAEGKFYVSRDTRELFYSFHTDDVNAESVMHKCVVHFIPENKKVPDRKRHPGFIVHKVYGAVEKKLWSLSDKEHDENRQQAIDALVKRTVDRIGELPDIEPRQDTPRGSTSRSSKKPNNFEKEKTLAASVNLKNYAILARYKAITGNEGRDKWLDKLLESIPLAWSKEIAARVHETGPGRAGAATEGSSNSSTLKIDVPGDNEKPYGLDEVVPIIVTLERSAYEALGTEFGKYNKKLRHLWYNIKNSPKLRKRLMNKELDPPALLVMSPDELKAGMILAKKTSEPEQPKHLQITCARCQRCQERKVGISDVIQAGHTDRYQLECTSCGHTWFSSYDAVSSLSPSSSSATVTGSTAAAAAVRAAAAAEEEKEKEKQVKKSRSSKLVRPGTKMSSCRLEAIPEEDDDS